MDPAFRPVHAITEGSFSSRSLVDGFLKRIEAHGEKLHDGDNEAKEGAGIAIECGL